MNQAKVIEQDVRLFIDNILRFVQTGSEVFSFLGIMPSAWPKACPRSGTVGMPFARNPSRSSEAL